MEKFAAAVRLILVLIVALASTSAVSKPPSDRGVRAVPTYESVGLYWSHPPSPGEAGCAVRYRRTGVGTWSDGLSLWYDSRNDECRGSLVHLQPGTAYEVELSVGTRGNPRQIAFRTWPNQWPVARVVPVAGGGGTLDITEGGSAATGYVVYEGIPGAVVDGLNAFPFNITVNASYVIIRSLTLVGAQQDAIRISPNVTDVVIEDNDISLWGRPRPGSPFGLHMDSAIRAFCNAPTLERVTIQRNRIHDPRYSANSWSAGNPAGPQAITFSHCGGNHVIRHNDMYSSSGNYFADIIGGEDNYTNEGFPHADTDIYGNRVSHGWDDGIEAEGRNMNVRIWGNYIDQTGIGIATTVTATGPVYIFRNVWNRNRFFAERAPDQDERQPFFKSGSYAPLGNGRRYVFHNTMLQTVDPLNVFPLGGGHGMGGTGNEQPVNNTVSMNNIYHLWKSTASAFFQIGTGARFVNDMTNGTTTAAAITNGILAEPIYEEGQGWKSGSGGAYSLKAGTPGYDGGARIPNFNDGYVGAAPDVGAHEAGTPNMKFALDAAGAPGAGGTLASSANPSVAGQGVTFTASFWGSAGIPTGTVGFFDGAGAIAGCTGLALSNGSATCTTASLAVGSHEITAAYSGDATYAASVAGPLEQTVDRK